MPGQSWRGGPVSCESGRPILVPYSRAWFRSLTRAALEDFSTACAEELAERDLQSADDDLVWPAESPWLTPPQPVHMPEESVAEGITRMFGVPAEKLREPDPPLPQPAPESWRDRPSLF
jgi:hypothetical protein